MKIIPLPFFDLTVPAGPPSSIENLAFNEIDLNELLIKHPAATLFSPREGQFYGGCRY